MGIRVGGPMVRHPRRKLCFACKSNVHRDCELHMNDGAVDALDFVHVYCECPCKGEVFEGARLIDLVEALRKSLSEVSKRAHEKLSKEQQQHDEILTLGKKSIKLIEEFIESYVDDEGGLLVRGRAVTWEKGVRILVDSFQRAKMDMESGLDEDEDEDEDEDGVSGFQDEDWLSRGHGS